MLGRMLGMRAESRSSGMERTRGQDVSRLEGFSDAVFGFAVTLLVIALEVPKTADQLVSMMAKEFVPFVLSFFVLFSIWRGQFDFFRRFRLEDRQTVRLVGVQLAVVLFLVYPLKFLFKTFFDAIAAGSFEELKLHHVISLETLPKVLGLYALGFLGIAGTFALMYDHAVRRSEHLGLDETERFDAVAIRQRWRRAFLVSALLTAWCGALLAIGGHFQARDRVFDIVYYGGFVAVITAALTQRFLLREQARNRDAFLRERASATETSR